MRVIYEPSGKAKEYADLAFNSYMFCPNGCKYCFAPNIVHKNREEFHACAKARKAGVYDDFERDCAEMERNGDNRRVHMNFLSDPYPDCEKDFGITRDCIEVAHKHGVKVNVLTKGKYAVIKRDFGLFKEAGVHFGVTCSFADDESRKVWEPNASSIHSRMRLLTELHNMGVFTWVSMEPVVYPQEALAFFEVMHPWVDLWKVGKLNYNKFAATVDWAHFRDEFVKKAELVGAKYVIKKSLLEA